MWRASDSFSADRDTSGLVEKCSSFRRGFFQAIQLKDTIQQWMHFLLKFSSSSRMSNIVVDNVDATLSSDSDVGRIILPLLLPNSSSILLVD